MSEIQLEDSLALLLVGSESMTLPSAPSFCDDYH